MNGTISLTQEQVSIWNVPERSRRSTEFSLRVGEVVSALSHALDLGTGQPVGHSVRSCLLAMRIAEEIGLSRALRGDLFYATLLKDAGCSTNASKMYHTLGSDDIQAKRDVKLTDWTRISWETISYALRNVAPNKPPAQRVAALWRMARNGKRHSWEVTKIRCERGATIARLVGLSEVTADGIASLDEHWNGKGQPKGLKKSQIPLLSRIMLLAQTLDVYFGARGAREALSVVRNRSSEWFDPDLVKAVCSIEARGMLWTDLSGEEVYDVALSMEPEPKQMEEDDQTFHSICVAFGQIVDSKSPFTFSHSESVARISIAIGQKMYLDPQRLSVLGNAALLHDLGKMGVSNEILEKPGELTEEEWRVMRLHPFYTWKILHAIPRFGELSEIAASHHEKLDGSGYFRGLGLKQLSVEARILAVAEAFDALTARTPYHEPISRKTVVEVLRKEARSQLDANCVAALEECAADLMG
jgi:HD-GYP domain-containing protein (c-di-GMP phosphodiesterase class II)